MKTQNMHREIELIHTEEDIYALFDLQDRYESMYHMGAINTPTHDELMRCVMDRQEYVSSEMERYYA